MRRPHRTLTRCLVCGFAEVRTDQVMDGGTVLLAECPRCEHRWTARHSLLEEDRRREPSRTAGRPPAAAAA